MIKKIFNDIRALKYKKLPGRKDYYVEYSDWFDKLKLNKEINLRVFDAGCDLWNTFYYYLKYKGFNIGYYEGYDINYHIIIKRNEKIIDKESLSPDLFRKKVEYYFNFIKLDCEGCEYDLLDNITFKRGNIYSIAIHNFKGLEDNFNLWKDKLKEFNFKLVYITVDKKEYLYVKS